VKPCNPVFVFYELYKEDVFAPVNIPAGQAHKSVPKAPSPPHAALHKIMLDLSLWVAYIIMVHCTNMDRNL
jgi:hypothetical protein